MNLNKVLKIHESLYLFMKIAENFHIHITIDIIISKELSIPISTTKKYNCIIWMISESGNLSSPGMASSAAPATSLAGLNYYSRLWGATPLIKEKTAPAADSPSKGEFSLLN